MNAAKGLIAAGIALVAVAPPARAAHTLANEKIRIVISEAGALESVENRLAAETYSFSADAFRLDTDIGRFSNRDTRPASVSVGPEHVVYHYEFGPADTRPLRVDLSYTLGGSNAWFRRTLSLSNAVPLRLGNLVLGATTFSRPAAETLHYVTFIAAPTVEFIRYHTGGLFTGIENPYFQADLAEQGMTLSFEPALILRPGEGYTSEPQFMGVYRMSGVMIEDTGREFRYNANGSGYKPFDRNESRAMRAFALEYLAPVQPRFLNINYQFFHPLPQMPRTDRDKDYFVKTIDTLAQIQGDMIIFKPLHPYAKPAAGRPFWNVLPDDPQAIACQVCDYAREKGLAYGFYMGCAAHGEEGNAGGLPFRPDKPEWKKSDAAGRRAPDNCLACDDYYDWWFAVQNNTIQKYRLSNWSWDPSLGSGMNCYDESHGHFADQGGYKGWRRCLELMARLKAASPGLFIQGFYGTKNFGLWGLKHVDQHEVLNEQSIIVSTRHHQISDDRQNADGLRFQNTWSMRFRFSPAVTGHALTHRVSEGVFDPELIKAWDYYGWEYGVMSSLAVAGTLMPTILPYETDLVPGFVEFYRKWQGWAKDHFDDVNTTEPFGEQVQPGAVDGYARIKEDHGFVFLFNGSPRPSRITFEVGDEINLHARGDYEFVELYPSPRGRLVLDDHGRSVFALGEKARLTVPANSCCLLELKRSVQQNAPVLVGTAGTVTLAEGGLAITGVTGKPGETVPIRVRVDDVKAVQSVTVNGVQQAFAATQKEICLELQFAGEKYSRALDAWTQADGQRFDFPYLAAQPELKLETAFVLPAEVRLLLERAKPKNFAEMDAKIASWQEPENKKNASYSYHNFIGARPSRLWLIVPFLAPARVELTLNGEKVEPLRWDDPSCSAYADVTDRVKYGGENRVTLEVKNLAENGFLGPFLLYPEEAATDQVRSRPDEREEAVVYTRVLTPAPPPRYRRGEGPKVTEANMLDRVTLRAPAELRVRVDLPPEKLRRVMFFESGFGWMGQHNLVYSPASECWTAMVTPGNRAAIQENEWVYVWAEGVDGLRSEYYPVKVGWDFTTGSRNPKLVAGAIEAESLAVQFKSRGRVEPQDMVPYGNHWSGDRQMVWWGGLEQGDRLVLDVPVEKAGSYTLALHLSKAEDYGIFRFQLDDGPESEALDLFHPRLQPPVILTLGPMHLAPGQHRLKITYQGKHPQSRNSLLGLDCLEWKAAAEKPVE